ARKPARPVEPPTDVEPVALTLADCRLDSDDPIARLVAFMSERYAIFKRRKAGEKWPWTTDPILRDAKFCNVFRESDRTSIWIAQNWRDPRRDDPDNWLPMALARFGPFETSALEAIGYPVSWNPGHVRAVLTERLQRKQPTFSSAYKGIMAEPGQSRVDSVIQVLDQMWCDREQLRPRPGDTCLSFCERLQSYPGVGGFLSAQVVADQKHIGSLYDATDWWWFAKPGPGSERGLHRVRKSTLIDSKWTEATWHRDLLKLQAQIALLLVAAGLPRLDAQNQQNCLCEFDKWERYRETGKIPRKYKPAGTEPTIAKTEKALKAEIGAAETKLDESKAEPEPATKTKPAPATTTTDDIPDYILADGEQRPLESKPEAPPPHQAKAETPKQPPPPPRNDGNGATDKRTSYPHGERDTGKRLEFYIYRDARGRNYLGVQRTSTKQFPQFHWTGQQWQKGLPKGFLKIPYRLPELLDAPPDAWVVIAAGEKDAETAAALGFVATTNSGGEGKGQWTPELGHWFVGKQHVAIMEDNDDAGHAHAPEAPTAFRGIVPDIRIVRFRELKTHGDLTDWINAVPGRGHAELLARIEAAAPAEPELDEWDAGEVLGGALPEPRQWLTAGQFCRTFLSGLVAPGDVGKTTLRLTQAIELATGRELVGLRVFQRCRALVLSFEDDRAELHRRLMAICKHHGIDPSELKGWLFCRDLNVGPKLAELDSKGRRRQVGALEGMLRRAIARTRCDLLILDPFVKLHGLNESDNPDMDFVCSLLIKIAQDCNIAV